MASADLPIRLSWKWASATRDWAGYRCGAVNPSSASRSVKSRLIQTLSRGERSLLSGVLVLFILRKGLLSAHTGRDESWQKVNPPFSAKRFPPVAASPTGLDALQYPSQLWCSWAIFSQIWELCLKNYKWLSESNRHVHFSYFLLSVFKLPCDRAATARMGYSWPLQSWGQEEVGIENEFMDEFKSLQREGSEHDGFYLPQCFLINTILITLITF